MPNLISGKISYLFIFAGVLFIFLAFLIFLLTFYPVLKEEINYSTKKSGNNVTVSVKTKDNSGNNNVIYPLDEEFGIVIPKINANARIMPNIDPYNPKEYQYALTKGVAHAKGTVLPYQAGNMFIFSHSSVNFYEASKYNSVFYLLSKLEKDDKVFIFYKKQKYAYEVSDNKIVDASDTSYLTAKSDKRILTLMTCWPPGTTFKRLLIIAQLQTQ